VAAGPSDLNEEFVRSLPDEGPVVMVNLVRFRERSLGRIRLGVDAYARYSKADIPLLKRAGGTILWPDTSRVWRSVISARDAGTGWWSRCIHHEPPSCRW